MVVDKKGYHSCQFIILLGDDEKQLSYLDSSGHSPFGECIGAESFETLDKINSALCDENDRPYDDIRIVRIHVLHDPFPDPLDKVPDLARATSPPPNKQLLDDYRIPKNIEGLDEAENLSDIDDEYEDKRDANQRAAILEMVGDLPNKDVTPDENVLFVCKLNPATQDEDLELIFSRFGEIKSCDIIRDLKSGDSLQYAFIEFENVEDCEKAYLKMDNTLIDERRIHVDFSQSVAKQWWRWRKNGKYLTPKFGNTDAYLADLHQADEPRWREDKVSYTNKWAKKQTEESEKMIKKENRDKKRNPNIYYPGDDKRDKEPESGFKKPKLESRSEHSYRSRDSRESRDRYRSSNRR